MKQAQTDVSLIVKALGVAAYMFGLLFGTAWSAASANEITLSEGMAIENVLDHMAEASDRPDGRQWHRLTVVNASDKTAVWRLSTELLQAVRFEFFLHEHDNERLIFTSRLPFRPQKTRASQGQVLASLPIVVQPGEAVEILAAFDKPADLDVFPIRLDPETAFDSRSTAYGYMHGWYLGATFIFLIFFIAFSVLLSSQPAAFYALYFWALVLLNFHSYGYLELWFFPESPWLYFPLFRILHFFIIASYLSFAASFLLAKARYPRLYRILRYYLVVGGILMVLELIAWHPFIVFLLDVMAYGFLGLGIFMAYLALRDRRPGSLFFSAGFGVLLLVGVINYIASSPPFYAYNNQVDGITLFLQIVDGLIFAAAIISQTYGLKRERDGALQAELQISQEKLAISEALLAAERDRDTARSLAHTHRQRLAATSHDLRQPLYSLKLALEEAQTATPDLSRKLKSSIDYLSSVLSDSLASSRQETSTGQHEDDHEPGRSEPVSLQIIFDNLKRMFDSEAKAKSLTLTLVPTQTVVVAEPVVLIRVLSNLISNAIKYTHDGGIVVGARRRSNRIDIEVWDSGPGLSPDDLGRVMAPYERGPVSGDVEGEGLGLSIVKDLADRHGFRFTARSEKDRGSVFTISGLKRVSDAKST